MPLIPPLPLGSPYCLQHKGQFAQGHQAIDSIMGPWAKSFPSLPAIHFNARVSQPGTGQQLLPASRVAGCKWGGKVKKIQWMHWKSALHIHLYPFGLPANGSKLTNQQAPCILMSLEPLNLLTSNLYHCTSIQYTYHQFPPVLHNAIDQKRDFMYRLHLHRKTKKQFAKNLLHCSKKETTFVEAPGVRLSAIHISAWDRLLELHLIAGKLLFSLNKAVCNKMIGWESWTQWELGIQETTMGQKMPRLLSGLHLLFIQ